MNSALSVNAMQMWLRFDTNRSKVLTHDEIKSMVEAVLGNEPSFDFMEELYSKWGLPDRKIDFKKWNELVPMKSNEMQLRQRFREIESDALLKKKRKGKNNQNKVQDRNAWAKDLLKNTYSQPQSTRQATLKGPQGLFEDQWGNEFKIEGRSIVGLDDFDGLRIEPNQKLILIQKGKEFRASFSENEIVWADGDVWSRKQPSRPSGQAHRQPRSNKTADLDGDYQDQFGNRFNIQDSVVRGIENFEGLDASEGGTVYMQQSGKRYRGKFDPSFGINWQDGDIWKRDPPGSPPVAAVDMGVLTHEVAVAPEPKKKPTLTDDGAGATAPIDVLQGNYKDQHGNEFVIDGTRIYGLDGFERMTANPRGLVITQSGVDYRATYDFNHIEWEDGDIWTKVDETNINDISGVYVDQYNNVFRIHGNTISGLEGFEGIDVNPSGRLEVFQKGATYGANWDELQITWDDQDIWKKTQPRIQGFAPGNYALLHAAAVTTSFQKDSPVEKEMKAADKVAIDLIVLVDDRIRGKISGSGWISMHSPEHDYTWVEPVVGAGLAGNPTPGAPSLNTKKDNQEVAGRPEMYGGAQAESGVWEKDTGIGVHTDSHVEFTVTPDRFRFYLIFALACFFGFCAIMTVLTVENWEWNGNAVEKELGFNTLSLMYQYEPLTTYIAPPFYCLCIIFVFCYIVSQWIRTLMLRRLNYIGVGAMKLYSFACILELACFITYSMTFSVPAERDITWHTIPLIVFQLGLSLTGWKNYYYYISTAGNSKKTRNSGASGMYAISMLAWSVVALWNTINMASRLNDKEAPLPLEETMQIIWSIMLGSFMLIGCGLGDTSETFEIRVNLLKSR